MKCFSAVNKEPLTWNIEKEEQRNTLKIWNQISGSNKSVEIGSPNFTVDSFGWIPVVYSR